MPEHKIEQWYHDWFMHAECSCGWRTAVNVPDGSFMAMDRLVKNRSDFHAQQEATACSFREGQQTVLNALAAVLSDKTDPSLIDAIVEDVLDRISAPHRKGAT